MTAGAPTSVDTVTKPSRSLATSNNTSDLTRVCHLQTGSVGCFFEASKFRGRNSKYVTGTMQLSRSLRSADDDPTIF